MVTTPPPSPQKEEPKPDSTLLQSNTALVSSITDGDTIKIQFTGESTIYPVRLIGIDTPETVDPRKPVECFGKEATAKLKSLIDGKQVTLKRDQINDNKDVYDRLLRYVYLDDQDINAEMIKQGYAYAYLKYPFESGKMELYKSYENQARENQVGLWAPGVCGNDIEDLEIEEEEQVTVAGTSTEPTENPTDAVKSDQPEQPDPPKPSETPDLNNNQSQSDNNFGAGLLVGSVVVLAIWGIIKLTKSKTH